MKCFGELLGNNAHFIGSLADHILNSWENYGLVVFFWMYKGLIVGQFLCSARVQCIRISLCV